ncbi:MAG: 16S rRNA (cytosine(1402)-N(4))-methyltransferase RsmH [Deltaproteobacteria bacterium]|nr:16S rRNA (cytosine(1402)-N(4))-methyltransferase RsmH [Deltaproteobacteria bacterium]
MNEFYHQPVLLKEAIDLLQCGAGKIFVDGTVGGGGHAEAILERIGTDGHLIGIDFDEEALNASKARLAKFGESVTLVRGNFAAIADILYHRGMEKIDGAIVDLGVSSHQLLSAERGFSFAHEAPLDMRMSRNEGGISAELIVNTFTEARIKSILKEYGEERMAGLIARAICTRRSQAPIVTTVQLAEIVARVVRSRTKGIHPATRTFQALRIAVNQELENIASFIPAIVPLLRRGSRLVVISFHSLEDRIVKHAFASLASSCDCPRGVPVCVCGKVPSLKIITKKPVIPGEQEIRNNHASRSAKLRVAERI